MPLAVCCSYATPAKSRSSRSVTGGVRTSGDSMKLVAASPGEASGKEIDGHTMISKVGRVALGILSSGVDKNADGF